jgi:hypothetical protein
MVEEWAANHAKAGLKVTAGEKLDVAIDSLVAKTGLSRYAAEDIIHAVLAQVGLGATMPSTAPTPEPAVSTPVQTVEPSAAPLPSEPSIQ